MKNHFIDLLIDLLVLVKKIIVDISKNIILPYLFCLCDVIASLPIFCLYIDIYF